MANLRINTPSLRRLHISLTYTDPSAFHDVHPHFDRLFPNPINVATWPENLESLTLLNLRNTSLPDIESFMCSLLEASARLVFLRHLIIKAILPDISWRERARCRQKWHALLERAFNPMKPVATAGSTSLNAAHGIRMQRHSERLTEFNERMEPCLLTSRCTRTDELAGNFSRQVACQISLTIDAQRVADFQYGMNDFVDADTIDQD